jgi:membrane dipeptidase
MKTRKKYDGYQAFQFLEAGVDYRDIKLAADVDRVEPYIVPTTDEEEAAVQRILDEEIIISAHEHASKIPEDVNEIFEYRRGGREFTGYAGLAQSGLDVFFENFMDGTALITSPNGWKWNDVIHDLGTHLCDIDHQDMVYLARTIDDLYRAKPEGKIAMVGVLEAATACENEVDRVDVVYGFGIRVMGITYSESNNLGSGLKEPSDGGLTTFGRKVVDRMNKLGMTIDVSHCGDKTALDTIGYSDKPVLITHCGPRALWDINRLFPDEVLKACADKGGLIGIEAAPHTTLTAEHPLHCIDSVMQHFEYTADLVGIDHVTFGPDTLFGDHVGLHHAFAEQLSIGAASHGPAFEEVPYVKGIENPGENFPNIIRWLVSHGYSREDIRKVVGRNTLRVVEATWAR